jgi:pyridoxine kinase
MRPKLPAFRRAIARYCRLMNILSIQSHVAYGHVGNASAVFPMQRLGVEVWPIHTVQFSNHTGYGAWRGRVFDGPAIEDLVEGIAERGVLPRCDGVLSGYMGSADIGTAILSAVARVRGANPEALYCCDPVIGDVGRGVFVRPGIPEFMRDHAVPAADIVTPNQFELDYLSGLTTSTLATAKEAVAAVHLLGPRVVLVTSLHTTDTPEGAIDLLAGEGGRFWRVRTPKLSLAVNGAGDAIAALFFVHYARTRSPATALGEAAASVYGLLKRTAEAGSREILTVAAQDEFVSPTERFEVQVV